MGGGKLGFLLGLWLMSLGVGAAESNSIEYDTNFNSDIRMLSPSAYLMENVVRIPIDWSSPIVPPLAEKVFAALSSVDHRAEHIGTDTGPAKVATAVYPRTTPAVSATRPAEGGTSMLEIPLFEGTVPPREAVINIDLAFRTATGTANLASYSTRAIVAKGSFGAGRILTVPTTSGRWTLLQQPVDIHFNATWWGGSPTYASIDNVKEGVSYRGIAPLNGPDRARGVIPIDAELSGPGSQKKIRIYAGSALLQEVEFHSGGVLLIFR